MKRVKKILLGVLIVAVAGAAYGFYLFNKKPADVRTLTPKFELTAAILVSEYSDNETAANAKYLDKVIEVKGKVADIKIEPGGQATVFLDSGNPLASVTCSFYNDELASVKKIQKGDEVKIKGMCTGILMDVVLNKCSIIN
jgi:hypothetical protein